jgi:uncharacterized protein YaeQ
MSADMAHPSTLYRFRIELSDVDAGIYESLDFRIAQHPSETEQFMLTRVIAFALNTAAQPEFSPGGLSDPDEPCIRALDGNGAIRLWIEVGSPSARKLHKAAKAAPEVKVYTYKNPEHFLSEVRDGDVHRAERIAIYSLAPEFLDRLARRLVRDNRWGIIHTEGSLSVSIGDEAEAGELKRHFLAEA